MGWDEEFSVGWDGMGWGSLGWDEEPEVTAQLSPHLWDEIPPSNSQDKNRDGQNQLPAPSWWSSGAACAGLWGGKGWDVQGWIQGGSLGAPGIPALLALGFYLPRQRYLIH